MKNILYKLDTFTTRTLYKYNNSYLAKILKNKILFSILLIIFLTSFGTYLYIIITNSTNGFQRMFNHNIFKLDNIKEKIGYLAIFSFIYFFFYFQKKIFNFLKKIFGNTLIIIYLLYLGLILFFISTVKDQIIYGIIPLILFFIYKICLYINETKEKYRFKFIFDSRYFFLIALILLIYTPIYLYFNDKKIAEQLSIYAYYALVIGVVYEIIISFFQIKTQKTKSKK